MSEKFFYRQDPKNGRVEQLGDKFKLAFTEGPKTLVSLSSLPELRTNQK